MALLVVKDEVLLDRRRCVDKLKFMRRFLVFLLLFKCSAVYLQLMSCCVQRGNFYVLKSVLVYKLNCCFCFCDIWFFVCRTQETDFIGLKQSLADGVFLFSFVKELLGLWFLFVGCSESRFFQGRPPFCLFLLIEVLLLGS